MIATCRFIRSGKKKKGQPEHFWLEAVSGSSRTGSQTRCNWVGSTAGNLIHARTPTLIVPRHLRLNVRPSQDTNDADECREQSIFHDVLPVLVDEELSYPEG